MHGQGIQAIGLEFISSNLLIVQQAKLRARETDLLIEGQSSVTISRTQLSWPTILLLLPTGLEDSPKHNCLGFPRPFPFPDHPQDPLCHPQAAGSKRPGRDRTGRLELWHKGETFGAKHKGLCL